MSRPSYFDRSRNLQINGDVNFISSGGSAEDDPSFFHVSQRVQASNAQSRAIDQGFKILCDNTAPSARYGYGHSFKGPQCHPGTRVAVQDHIFKWFDDENGEIAMWMHGPVGIGKSAIAQTVAHLAAERDQLSSAFFFFRSDDTRNTERHLVATLAYEMTQQMPHTRDHVCQTVASNPLIFSSPLEHQIEYTLLRPATRCTSESSSQRRLMIIDGLDECLNTHTQQVIIRSFISTLLSDKAASEIPHKILIASRPESHIASVLSAADISPHVKHLALDSWDMKDDIRSFLRAKLDEIRQTHPLKHHLPNEWPDYFSFHSFLQRSLGSFAYASVAIRYLSSHNSNPEHTLQDLLSVQSTQVAVAFSDLNALYRHILVSLDPKLCFVLQKILCLHVYSRGCRSTIRSLAVALLEDHSTVELAVIRVSSLIKIGLTNEPIKFHHTSFEEFLCDKARSGDLYVFSPKVASAVATALSNLWLHPISDQSDYLWFGTFGPFDVYEDSGRIDMTRQLLNTLVETKLPTSFLNHSRVRTPINMSHIDSFWRFKGVLSFCVALHQAIYWKPHCPNHCYSVYQALCNQAFNIVCAWQRSHLDNFFRGVLGVKDIIDFLLEGKLEYSTNWGESYQSPPLRIFRSLVEKENMSLLSSCICQVFHDIEYTDICHGILERYLALSFDMRRADIKEWGGYNGHVVTLTKLYCMVLHRNIPSIPSVCQRLEQIICAGQIALSSVVGSQLTSRDYIFRFFYGDRCYIDTENQLAIGGRKVSDIIKLEAWLVPYSVADSFVIAEITDLYIRRAHAEKIFPYISADVETICRTV